VPDGQRGVLAGSTDDEQRNAEERQVRSEPNHGEAIVALPSVRPAVREPESVTCVLACPAAGRPFRGPRPRGRPDVPRPRKRRAAERAGDGGAGEDADRAAGPDELRRRVAEAPLARWARRAGAPA